MSVTFRNLLYPSPIIIFFLGMHLHHEILKDYSKYNSKQFKKEYEVVYKHIYSKNSSAHSFHPTSLATTEPNITNEPSWALYWNNSKPIFMSVFVLSAPANFVKRNQMRIDFYKFLNSHKLPHGNGKMGRKLSTLTFLIGNSGDSFVEIAVRKESKKYGDILKLSLVDSYKNCAYKILGAFGWINKLLNAGYKLEHKSVEQMNSNHQTKNNVNHKEQVTTKNLKRWRNHNNIINWIVKVDDDMVVNYRNLLSELEKETQERNSFGEKGLSILCSAVLNNHVAEWRNNTMTRKWLVVICILLKSLGNLISFSIRNVI